MSFIDIAIAVVGTAATAYSADQSRKAQNNATDQAKKNALATQQASEEANNRANAKGPNTAALLASNMLAGKSGQASTMLTGPGGIDPTLLTLGKTSLLGS